MLCLSTPPIQRAHGSHADLPSKLRLMLINGRSISNKTTLIPDLITDEELDLACIIETWGSRGGDVNLSLLGPLAFESGHLPEVGGAGRQRRCSLLG